MRNRKKRKAKKYDTKPIIMMLILGTFFVMTTYAWFTTNRMVQISSLQLNIQASDGFQISLDAVNWKTVIQVDEILGTEVNDFYPTNVNHLPGNLFLPVSTATLTDPTTGFMDMFLGSVDMDERAGPTFAKYVISADKITETQGMAGNFVAFDLFFKTNFEIELQLSKDAGVTDIATLDNRKNKGMENAARIAFLNQGIVPMSSGLSGNDLADEAQDLVYTDYQDGRNVTIWEPNYDKHTDATKIEAYNLFGIPITATIWDGSSRIEYEGIYKAIPKTSPILLTQANETQNGGYFKSIPSTRFIATPKEKDERDEVTNTSIILEAGVTKMRLYIWLEGQDYDCGDSASGSDIQVDLILIANKV